MQIAASIILGSLAILIFGIQPVLYAAFVGEGLIEPDGLGLLSAAEVVAIAIGSSLAIPALKHASVRTIAGSAILLVTAANYLQAYYGTADMLFAFRILAGLGSGFLVGIAGMTIAGTKRVGQWAAGYLLAQATSQFLHLQWFALFWPAPTSCCRSRLPAQRCLPDFPFCRAASARSRRARPEWQKGTGYPMPWVSDGSR
jgi:DHA1 family inner membrane transport protein